MSDTRLDKAAALAQKHEKRIAALEKEVSSLRDIMQEILENQKATRNVVKENERKFRQAVNYVNMDRDGMTENHHFWLRNLNALLKANGLPTLKEFFEKQESEKRI